MATSRKFFSPDSGPVLLFDGECGLCNRIVRVLLRLDGGGRLRFAPLQGPAAQAYLRAVGLPTKDFDSLVFVPDWARRGVAAQAGRGVAAQAGHGHGRGRGHGHGHAEYLLRTDGVIAALRGVGGAGRGLAAVLAIFPAAWRDAGYRLIARWRYRIFGKWRDRPLARAEWAERFLD